MKVYDTGRSMYDRLLSGVNKLHHNVASTLGPKGRNVILHQKGSNPIITKDGVTVAKFVDLEDPVENTAVQIMKMAAIETVNNAGDGTTTATVLAYALFNEAYKHLVAGVPAIQISRGMHHAAEMVISELEDLSRPVETIEALKDIATISANGDTTIGRLVAKAVEAAGQDGAIVIEEAKSLDTSLDLKEGFRIDSGYYSPKFITNERKHAGIYHDPIIFVTDYKLDRIELNGPLWRVLELAAKHGKPLVIVAEEIEGQALAALIMNSMNGTMKVAAVKAPRYGEERKAILEDLCTAVGAKFFSRDRGIKMDNIQLEDFGTARRVEIFKEETIFVDGNGEWANVDARIQSLKEEIKQTDDWGESRTLQERATRLASGVAIIRVGGLTEVEMIEKKHRIEDALEAVRSSQQGGVLPGAGRALVTAAEKAFKNKDLDASYGEQVGYDVVLKACDAPVRMLAKNSGLSPDMASAHYRQHAEEDNGYNFATGQTCNLIKEGIIDPAKVTKTALRNAVSVVGVLITTDNIIIES